MPASTVFTGAPVSDEALAGQDRGFRYEVAFNAKDLSSPWDAKLPADPAAHIDDAIEQWGEGSTVTQLYFYLYDYAKTDIPDETIVGVQQHRPVRLIPSQPEAAPEMISGAASCVRGRSAAQLMLQEPPSIEMKIATVSSVNSMVPLYGPRESTLVLK